MAYLESIRERAVKEELGSNSWHKGDSVCRANGKIRKAEGFFVFGWQACTVTHVDNAYVVMLL